MDARGLRDATLSIEPRRVSGRPWVRIVRGALFVSAGGDADPVRPCQFDELEAKGRGKA